MKKIILLFAFLSFLNVTAQQKIAQKIADLVSKNTKFEHFSILNGATNTPTQEINEVVKKATFAQVDFAALSTIVQSKLDNIEVEIPYQGTIITVQLYKVDIFHEGFHIDTDKQKNIPYEKGVYYRGIVKGDQTSLVCFNFFNADFNGIISSDDLSNLVIAKLDKSNNISDYIVYKDEDLKMLNTFSCHTKDIPKVATGKTNKNPSSVESTRCATVYFEIDYNLFQNNGNSTTTTTNWMTSVFNNVQTIYTNDTITVALKSMYIWTTQDPYEGIGTSSSDYLYKFNDVRPVFDGDIGQLVGIDPGGLGGVAVTINGLCSGNNFSYSDVNFSYSSVPTYSWTIEVITHELGHLLGSPHTHGCYWNGNNTAIDGCATTYDPTFAEGTCPTGPLPSSTVKGTIMSYCHLLNYVGIKFSNGFGPQPRAVILDAVNTATCLSSDCVNTCINNITTVAVNNITDVSANVVWTEQGGTTTSEVSVFPLSNTSGTWTTPTTNTYPVTGLTPNTYYKAIVRNLCGGGLDGPDRTVIFVTSGDFCSGIPLTDSGGPNGDYLDFETIVRTIIPANPNAKAKLTFTSFDLEQDYDYLYVYNGHDTTFPDLSGGGFTGNTIPSPITSTASDGALTIKFASDGGVVMAGYEATVSCLTLGTNEFTDAIDFSYYPNPTNTTININSKTMMSDVAVYNVQGQLLLQQKINSLDTKIDISSFANGTYFFKLKFDQKEVNFKVMKM